MVTILINLRHCVININDKRPLCLVMMAVFIVIWLDEMLI